MVIRLQVQRILFCPRTRFTIHKCITSKRVKRNPCFDAEVGKAVLRKSGRRCG